MPSGASTGVHEALELRDNDKSKYHGKSVFKAVDNINNIIVPELLKVLNLQYPITIERSIVGREFWKINFLFQSGLEVTQQTDIDNLLLKIDGTPNKAKLGANAILGVSLAVCKAGAAKKGIPLYKWVSFVFVLAQLTHPFHRNGDILLVCDYFKCANPFQEVDVRRKYSFWPWNARARSINFNILRFLW